MEPDGSADDENGPIDTRLFAVSQQLHTEASDAFFHLNTIMVPLNDDHFLGLPPPMFKDDDAASNIQHAYVRKLRNVDIVLPMVRNGSEAPRLKWVLERVCCALRLSPRLEKVRVSAYIGSRWYKPEYDGLMDGVLEALLTLVRRPTMGLEFITQADIGDERYIRVLGTRGQKERLCGIINDAALMRE